MRTQLLMMVVVLASGCARVYGGENCAKLEPGTSREGLPFGAPGPQSVSGPAAFNPFVMIASTPEFACCISSDSVVDESSTDVCRNVDCNQLLAGIKSGLLGNQYHNELCVYPQGDACKCIAVVDDEKLVAVFARWED